MVISHRMQFPLLSLHLAGCFLLQTLRTGHCRAQKQPGRSSSGAKLPTWKILIVPVLMLLAATAFNLLKFAIRKRRNKENPRSVNGGMMRSYSPAGGIRMIIGEHPASARDNSASASDTSATAGPSELGCVKLAHKKVHVVVGRPARLKMRMFDYDMLADATDDFNGSVLKRGRSSSGTMFRGTLVSDEGLEIHVAIKKFHHIFSEDSSKHVFEDLKDRLLRHRNLLCPFVVGYCLRKGKLYVVYDYMVNGSLDKHLFTEKCSPKQRLSWAQRRSIINGVAAGLHHLHRNNAVHGSVKASNILLDQDMTARLGDFGYSRAVSSILSGFRKINFVLERNTCLAPGCFPKTIMGTTISNPTYEMDIFNFGKVILEVVCGIPESQLLADQVRELYRDDHIIGAVDATLAEEGDFSKDEAEKLLRVSLACRHPDPMQRLGIEDVIKILTGSMPPPAVPL